MTQAADLRDPLHIKVRSYAAVLGRIEQVTSRDPSWKVAQIALLTYPPDSYPLIALRRRGLDGALRVSISAGIHGDEPATVEAVLQFLESDLPGRSGRLDLTVLPCQNPFGYAHDTRFNGCGLDLNRQFDKPRTPAQEAQALRRFALQRQIDLVVDCHEDSEADGFYVWELKGQGLPDIGRAVVEDVARSHRITAARVVEGCPVTQGIAQPTPERVKRTGGWSHTYFLFQNGTPHCVTPETPASCPLEARVQMHLKAIRAAIDPSLNRCGGDAGPGPQ